ncbi:CG9646 [Drosophila busckii]|uniref:CG9646 n=1 Tax=Drosophila busckii TaxID=30019 RepID=A0A0M5J273_DROBS|nr:CG9646 [Drosophila busckii]
MALASAAGALLKPQTPLQQLLEDINFQRTKEMRQLLKDDGGFVVLQGTTYWTDLFVRHFLFQTEPVHSIDSDDLLFFVRKKHVKSSSRHMPKYEAIEVFRKDSRKLPIGDPDVDWEETVYLNMVIHQFDYTLTLAICTRTSPKELQVLRRHSQRVYASPSRRKMDTKGEGEEITYPHICFMVDNFDEVFSDILVRDGEMVCVELVANDKDGAVQGVIFLGSIRYDALKKVYDARQSSLSSKVAQRMSFGLFSSGAGVQTRCEFVRMKGPQGKGHAEMAVTKPKGSGVETPTSEPGFCATDMWDEWEEENDDYCTYRHQRRLSDPSANLNNFSRYGWRTKNANPDMVGSGSSSSAGVKARSENEGLDSLASEVSEIEAGDLRDDQQRPAFSASAAKLHPHTNCETHKGVSGSPDETPAAAAAAPPPAAAAATTATVAESNETETAITAVTPPPLSVAVEVTVANDGASAAGSTGCNCFGGKKCKKRWSSSNAGNADTPEMSEVYCPSCEDAANETPACLAKMPDKRQTRLKPKPPSILCVESELVVSKSRGSLRLSDNKRKSNIARSASLSATDRRTSVPMPTPVKKCTPARVRLSKPKELDKSKDKDKENDKKSTNQKGNSASNLLAKMSPKRLRNAKASDKEKNKDKGKGTTKSKAQSASNNNTINAKATTTKDVTKSHEEYELADDATSLNGDAVDLAESASAAKMAILSESDSKLMISVRGREELPVVELDHESTTPTNFEKCIRVPVKSESHPLQLAEPTALAANATNDNNVEEKQQPQLEQQQSDEATNAGSADAANGNEQQSATLPRTVKQSYYNKVLHLVPKRRTPDGTNIYYWCDLPKKALKELDDGAYNPLWTSRGFTQSFHFWKENRRQQSTPLNAFLTYVTLPWWSIAKDLLDHRETPILTF